MAVGKLVKRQKELFKGVAVIVADAKRRINKNMSHVVIAGENARNEPVKRTGVKDKVLVNIDESATVVDIIAELYPLFDANDRTLAGLNCLVDQIDRLFVLPEPLTPINNLSISVTIPFPAVCRSKQSVKKVYSEHLSPFFHTGIRTAF